MIGNRQNQRVSLSEKMKSDWYINNFHYFMALALQCNNKDETLNNIDAANGIVDSKTYAYVVKPLQANGESLGNLPGEIRDVDFINPIREKNIGEYLELPHDFTVKVDDPDITLLRSSKISAQLTPILEQVVINLINSQQNNPNAQSNNTVDNKPSPENENMPNSGVPSKNIDNLEEVIKETIANWFDERGDKASNLVNWINDNNDINNLVISAFTYWWSTEECYILISNQNNEVFYDLLSPLEGFPITNGNEYVEDQEAFIVKRSLTMDRIIELYDDDLTKKDRDYLELLFNNNDTHGYSTSFTNIKNIYGRKIFDDAYVTSRINKNTAVFSNTDSINENILFFKTQVKRKILYKYNNLGQIVNEIIQDDNFVFNKELGHIDVKSEWITETWKQVLLGEDYTGIYLKPKPIDVQVYDRRGHNKLPIAGKKGLLNGIYINPIPKRILPNLAMYRTINLQIEREIAKFKGVVEIIPKSLLIGDNGDVVGNMLYRMANNSYIYDDSQVNPNVITQGYRLTGDDKTSNFIKTLIDYKQYIKNEAWDMANMNSSRNGDAPASATVTNNQQNIFRAKLGSSLMITLFNNILLKLYSQALEYSKVAYVKGINGTVRNQDKITYFNFGEGEITETNYGIFMSNAINDFNKLEEYKKLAFNASQNGDLELATEAIDSDNLSKIRKNIKKLVKINKEHAEAMAKQEQDNKMAIEQAKLQDKVDSRELELDKIRIKENLITDRELELAKLKIGANNETNINNE